MSRGKMVASGAPADLVREIGQQVLEVTAPEPASTTSGLSTDPPDAVSTRMRHGSGSAWVPVP